MMSGFGASVLGYRDARVDAAACAAHDQYGPVLTGPTVLSIELAERLTALRPAATWAILGKNGSDVTSAAARAARAGTGKQVILRAVDGAPHAASKAYHGATSQWLGGSPGVLAEESSALERGYTCVVARP